MFTSDRIDWKVSSVSFHEFLSSHQTKVCSSRSVNGKLSNENHHRLFVSRLLTKKIRIFINIWGLLVKNPFDNISKYYFALSFFLPLSSHAEVQFLLNSFPCVFTARDCEWSASDCNESLIRVIIEFMICVSAQSAVWRAVCLSFL